LPSEGAGACCSRRGTGETSARCSTHPTGLSITGRRELVGGFWPGGQRRSRRADVRPCPFTLMVLKPSASCSWAPPRAIARHLVLLPAMHPRHSERQRGGRNHRGGPRFFPIRPKIGHFSCRQSSWCAAMPQQACFFALGCRPGKDERHCVVVCAPSSPSSVSALRLFARRRASSWSIRCAQHQRASRSPARCWKKIICTAMPVCSTCLDWFLQRVLPSLTHAICRARDGAARRFGATRSVVVVTGVPVPRVSAHVCRSRCAWFVHVSACGRVQS
jgi:hypothetical protein